jgi:ribosome maturation factor RimP
MKRDETISKIEAIATQIATPRDIEIVEIELKGTGRHHLLRIYIDKPEGITHTDCEFVSREVSAVLDADDPFPGTWELEVSSPGVERKLGKWKDWERFTGKKVTVTLNTAAPGSPAPHYEGLIARAQDNIIALELPDGSQITFPAEQVNRANLKFEW